MIQGIHQRLGRLERAYNVHGVDVSRLGQLIPDGWLTDVAGEAAAEAVAPVLVSKLITEAGQSTELNQIVRIGITPVVPYTGGSTIETATYTLTVTGHSGGANGTFTLTNSFVGTFSGAPGTLQGSLIRLAIGTYSHASGWFFANGRPGLQSNPVNPLGSVGRLVFISGVSIIHDYNWNPTKVRIGGTGTGSAANVAIVQV